MLLLEAIKSGKPFRRREWEPNLNGEYKWVYEVYDCDVDNCNTALVFLNEGSVTLKDILADDYAVKNE